MSLHYLETILEFLADISWPVVAVFAVLVFKKPLTKLIENIKKWGKEGVEFRDAKPQVSSKSIELPGYMEQKKAGWAVFEREYFDQRYKEAKAALDEIANEGQHDPNEQLFEAFLISQAQNTFERWYNEIYLSQILALTAINNSGGAAQLDIAKQQYEEAKNGFPDFYSNVDFEIWFSYLVNSGIVTSDGVAVSLTAAGRSFLKYISARAPYAFKIL